MTYCSKLVVWMNNQ